MASVICVLNKKSRDGLILHQWSRVSDLLDARQIAHDVIDLTEGDLATSLRAAIARRPDLRVVAGLGGDGTHMSVLNALQAISGGQVDAAPAFAICPFGTLNDVVQKFVGHKRPVPIFLRKYGIWIIDAIFILITWGDHVFGMVESPWVSGVVMLMITTAVVASGALWERRTFCRYLCFLGGLSGNYSQTGMLALRSKPEKCAQCKDPVCYKGAKTVPGCRMFEYPRVMDSSANCNLCGDCVKSCPHDSLTLTGRLPSQELWSVHKPKLAAAFLAVVIMGIVFLQNITMLEMWQGILSWLENLLHTKNYFVTFTVTFLVILPIPIYLLTFVSFVAKKINGDTLAQNFTRFGYAIIALDVAGHIAHNLFHLLAEGKSVYITALMFAGREAHGISPALLSSPTIQLL